MHPDHVGGVNSLRADLGHVKVAAHRLTAEPLKGTIRVDRFIEDGDTIDLNGSPRITLQAMHTPGHARGHLCFYEKRAGSLISGDNILGLGSVLIDPPEGNMRDYLHSLKRMRALANLSVIFGGHGPAIGNPYGKIDEYISHRLEREQNILRAVRKVQPRQKRLLRWSTPMSLRKRMQWLSGRSLRTSKSWRQKVVLKLRNRFGRLCEMLKQSSRLESFTSKY